MRCVEGCGHTYSLFSLLTTRPVMLMACSSVKPSSAIDSAKLSKINVSAISWMIVDFGEPINWLNSHSILAELLLLVRISWNLLRASSSKLPSVIWPGVSINH